MNILDVMSSVACYPGLYGAQAAFSTAPLIRRVQSEVVEGFCLSSPSDDLGVMKNVNSFGGDSLWFVFSNNSNFPQPWASTIENLKGA